MGRCPPLFGCSVDTNLEPTLDWLQQRLDVDDVTVSKMIRRLPSILGMNIDAMEPKINWLQQRLNLGDAAASKVIQKLPSLLCSNVDANIKPTLDFYVDVIGDEKQALDMVTHDPLLFSYSLEKRLKPRLQEARAAGITIDSACLKRIA